MQSLQPRAAYLPSVKRTNVLNISASKSKKSFGNALKMQEADTLIRSTRQHQKWQKIRQNNDALAIKLADMILDRHGLIQKAMQGNDIDWKFFDYLTNELAQHDILLFNGHDIKNKNLVTTSEQLRLQPQSLPSPSPLSPPAEASSSPPQTKISEENLLILDMKIDNTTLQTAMIGYGSKDCFLLPLGGVSKALDLAVDVDPAKGKAAGWYISEDRTFLLDIEKGTVEIDGQTNRLKPGQVEPAQDDIYVDSKILGKWFPADFNIIFSKLSVQVEPREKFPIQERLAREELRDQLERRGHKSKAKLPFAESKYNLFSMPFIDVSSSNSFDVSDDDSKFTSTNTIKAKGDLAYMSSDIFISGTEDEPLENVTFKLERNDPLARLFGPLHATSFALGDITTTKLPFVNSKIERGASLDNRDLVRQSEFDTTRFEGDLPPGWEVEIYQNKNLVAATAIGSDGHYEFDDIPVYFGENRFNIISYGPQGQKKIETEIINVGTEMLPKGKSRYKVSISEQDAKTIELDSNDRPISPHAENIAAKYEYGITNNFSVSGGVAGLEIDKLRHDYFNVGLQGTFAGIFARADIVHDNKSGTATQFLAQSSLGPFRIRAKQDFLYNFTEPYNYDENNPVQTRTDVSLTGKPLKVGLLPSMPYSFSFQHTKRKESQEIKLSGRLSTRLMNTRISNTINAGYDSARSAPTEIDGNVYFSRWIGPVSLRGNAQYDIEPETRMKEYGLTGALNLTPELSAQMNLTKSMDNNKKTESSLSLNWDTGKMLISPKLSYDSEKNLSAFLSLNFSIGKEPRTGRMDISSKRRADSGAVSALVFHDKNNNRIFDVDDVRLKDVEVKATQARKKETTDENGIALITSLPKFQKTDVEIDPETLEDPFWMPTFKGNSISPRPGETRRFDFPVVTTGEIDGTVYRRGEDSSNIPLTNSEIILFDNSGNEVQRTISEYDGFYLFDKIIPGEYSVKIIGKNDNSGQPPAGAVAKVTIGPDGTVINGLDFIVHGQKIFAATEQAAPESPEPEPQKEVARFFSGEHSFIRRRDGVRQKIRDADDERPTIRLVTPGVSLPAPTGIRPEGLKIIKLKQEKILPEPTLIIEPQHFKTDINKNKIPGDHTPIVISSNRHKSIKLSSRPGIQKPGQPVIHDETPRIRLTSRDDIHRGGITQSEDTGPVQVKLVSRPLRSARHIPVTNQPVFDRPGKTSLHFADRTGKKPMPAEHPLYGVQLASFRSITDAASALQSFQKSFKMIFDPGKLSITIVDLGPEKGIWHRVTAHGFPSKSKAAEFKQALAGLKHDSMIVDSAIGSRYEIHMASYKTTETAVSGLNKIKNSHGDILAGKELAIKRVDLGREKGIWFRIIAGGFAKWDEAMEFSKRLSLRKQYGKVLIN